MTAVIIILCVTAVLVGLYLFLIFPSLRRHRDIELLRGKYIAHRGFHGLLDNTPENSLNAFSEAVKLGYPIEIDIHLTADGKVVVFHDDTLTRMCGVDGRVEDMTLTELKKCRLADTDCEIPTLEEVLQTVNGRVPLLIEFKCISLKCDALCEAANEILKNYNGKYLIQSFYPTVLRWYKKHRPDICRGQLSEAFKGEKLYKRTLGNMLFNFLARPDFVSYRHFDAKKLNRRAVTKLGAYPVGWTFQTQAESDKNGKYFKTWIFEGFIPK